MKKIYLFVPLFVLSLFLYTVLAPVAALSEDISCKVYRLHIIANSDSEEDQALKLKIRDGILRYTEELFQNCESVNEAAAAAQEHLSDIQQRARQLLAFYGSEYDVMVQNVTEYFPVREYEGFALPAGRYKSLKIIIGEGQGKNWWCVMYPAVCLSGCTDDFRKSLTDEEADMVCDEKYVLRFKIVEVVEWFRQYHKDSE